MEFAADTGSIRVSLDAEEAALLARLLGELRAVVEGDARGDPVTERLFPRAYEDRRDQKTYEDLVGDQLRADKLAAIIGMESVLGAPGPLVTSIPPQELAGWLPVVTDLRLAIGTRLDVDETKMDRQIDINDPEAAALSILHWLGWMQESLLEALRRTEEQT